MAKYVMLADSVVPQVLDLAKKHQKGRGTDDVPDGTFDFTEGWFRTSGLYGLCPEYQARFMEAFATAGSRSITTLGCWTALIPEFWSWRNSIKKAGYQKLIPRWHSIGDCWHIHRF